MSLMLAMASSLDDAVLARADLWWLAFALPLAIAAFVWGARQRAAALRSLGEVALVSKLVATVDPVRRVIAAVLVCTSVALVVGGLLRLQYGGVAKVVPAAGLDVVLVVDYSKSMLAKDVYPSRSERLEAELAHFLDASAARGDRVGVVVFAGNARGLPVTSDMRLLRMYLDRADPRTENPGGTAIGKALDLGLQLLLDARAASAASGSPAANADPVLVLLTDGEDNESRPMELAARAAEAGVRIFAVGIGSKTGEPVLKFSPDGEPAGYVTDEEGNYVFTRLDEESLKALTEATKGEYVHADAESFGLDAISESLANLTRAQREDTLEIHREEGFAVPILPALVLLCVSMALGDRRRRTGR